MENLLGQLFFTQQRLLDEVLHTKRAIYLSMNTVALQQLSILVTRHCNLNCCGCSSFAPLSPPEFLKQDQFASDMERLSSLLNQNLITLYLMGGEPLLHEELPRFFGIARTFFPHSSIKILTNGILLAWQKALFWEEARKHRIVIEITKYPVRLDFSRMEEKLKTENVKYTIHHQDQPKTLRKDPLNPEGDEFIIDAYMRCTSKRLCSELVDGKLYICSTCANIDLFNQYFGAEFHRSDKDFLDIYDTSLTAEDIYRFVASPVPFCRYCRPSITNLSWKTSKREGSEWI